MTEIFIICILGGYLLGSIPFGLVVTRLAGLGDIRKIGSGNIGATNVLRTGRKDLALLTVLLDVFKAGFAAWLTLHLVPAKEMFFAGIYTQTNLIAALYAGTAAVIGHNFPIWLKFRGGKGVASTFGLILVLSPNIALMALATWLLFAFMFKYSSLAALAAATLTPLYAYFYAGETETIFYTAIALLVIVRHQTNIRRLIKGEESQISLHKKTETAKTPAKETAKATEEKTPAKKSSKAPAKPAGKTEQKTKRKRPAASGTKKTASRTANTTTPKKTPTRGKTKGK